MENGEDSTQEFERRRRARSLAIALSLAGLMVLFFIMTLVRIGANITSTAQ